MSGVEKSTLNPALGLLIFTFAGLSLKPVTVVTCAAGAVAGWVTVRKGNIKDRKGHECEKGAKV